MTEQASAVSWSAGGRSVIGAAHIHYGVPNQDAIAWWPQEAAEAAVLALADGHGASIHYRSAIGAHVAVEVAVAALREALAARGWIAAGDQARGTAVMADILARWRAGVRAHLEAHPTGADTAAAFALTPYGATLLAAAVSPEGVFVLQLGDGDLTLGTADGRAVRPLPDDVGLVGEQTYSLCQPDAESHVRLRVVPAAKLDVDFVMLASDGLGKSFPRADAVEKLAAAWRGALAAEGVPAVLHRLDGWLPEISQRGSGDDISLGFLVRAGMRAPAAAVPPEWPTPVARTVIRTITPPAPPRRPLRWKLATLAVLAATLAVGGCWLRYGPW